MSNGEQPHIIVKKKKGHHGAHGGAWKVAYADFVTAMMALFIVLWVLSQSEEVKQAVASYFQDPLGISQGTREMIDSKSGGMIDAGIQVKKVFDKEAQKEELKKLGEEIIKNLSGNTEFLYLMDQVKIDFVDEGMRIEMLESKDNFFFEIGSAKLNPSAEHMLEKIGAELSKLPNKVILEGHTDSRPYPNADVTGYSNYELSADRANSARRAIIKGGFDMSHIDEVRGYADKRLRDPKDPYNLVNRRISIIVKYAEH